jgi:glycosyltransferase involved in cell wall biosynthesis
VIKTSVAMTTYNGERYIAEQLESIRNQTLAADEVVIFDDASSDDTAKITGKYLRDNKLDGWKLVVNKKNVGYKENFYRAIENTTGDIIFLCDQDDVWHADKIETMTKMFESNPRIKALNTGFTQIDDEGKTIYSKKRLNRANHNLIRGRLKPNALRKFELDEIVWRNISPGCTAAIAKECKEMFLEHYSRLCPHDWELNIFGALLDGLYFYNRELTDYRIHEDNTIGMIKLTLQERVSLNTDNQKRIARAKNECERAERFYDSVWGRKLESAKRGVLARFRRLTKLRCQMVTEPSVFLFMRAMFHVKDYIKLMGPQGIVDDLKYTLRKH